ncbi:protein ALP1-like [Daphnia magna]|uniref:protein ALP1-like n=1 Tax=Daphnia magna TaxID=35525 RepID=UPI001E1BB17B|nr:protein ALP1-like [Daphnia magna]
MESSREGPREFSGVQEYIERTITGYSDPYFKKHFRMSRQSFEHLAHMMAIYLNSNDSGVPVQTKLLLTLWTLANVESFRGIGDRFGMYMGNVHYIFLCTTRAFRLNSIKLIKWPTRAEYRSITLQFSFPYAIGSVDSTFIRIRKPLKKYNVYTNRKKFCAVTLQAVSKPNLEFIDVSTGYPSSMHDASVFAHSQLGRNLSILLEGTPFVLLGDSAYGLTTTLMKPYPDNGRLDETEKNFNRVLSQNRYAVERSFSLLKRKWRRLRYLDMLLLNRIPDVILTACCLHNYIIQRGDVQPEDQYREDDEENDDEEEERDSDNSTTAGKQIRNRIKYLLMSFYYISESNCNTI